MMGFYFILGPLGRSTVLPVVSRIPRFKPTGPTSMTCMSRVSRFSSPPKVTSRYASKRQKERPRLCRAFFFLKQKNYGQSLTFDLNGSLPIAGACRGSCKIDLSLDRSDFTTIFAQWSLREPVCQVQNVILLSQPLPLFHLPHKWGETHSRMPVCLVFLLFFISLCF